MLYEVITHLNIGAGRVIYQDLVKINKAVEDGSIAKNETIVNAFNYAKANNKAVHFLGLIGPGGVHATTNHLLGLCSVANNMGLEKVYIHGFTDGRDTDPKSGKGFLQEVVDNIEGTIV